MAKKKKFRSPFNYRLVFRVFALIVSFAAVEYLYATVIEPRAAEASIMETLLADDLEAAGETQRSLAVILKNTEQQICMSLLLWAFLLLFEKYLLLSAERKCLNHTFIDLARGERIIPANALSYYRSIRQQVEKTPSLKDRLLPAFLLNGLHRFHATHSVSSVSESIQQEAEFAADQWDSDLSLIRYIGWAIPSIGFIGTVRGIGEALAQAEQAIEGDISGVTSSLGLAFNSTLVALLFSIFLTFFVFMFQAAQEKMILSLSRYSQDRLIGAMKVPAVETRAAPSEDAETLPKASLT